ncbi:hypothetical protein GQ464_012140 [Rhodocaloribacter litoris]|uniref:hypothetical protein n=1 Tax=Rhodocaloribacter litoris TaxID=2558931 RepID=UPI00141E772F|nr:hypothetical protein [Rhodocaloribacter litoris]QXD14200.1 hypothetical protein GQ464_012140 [Rhodocaloribacter litoris]GIV59927.1 MAG: hypothetical protein KatS3mg043_1016 [Rhodothermaceae bacterium]
MLKTGLWTLLVLLTGCTAPRDEPAPAAPWPADWRLVCGQGGGVAGRWTGYTITADGTVTAWSGRYAEERVEATGALDRAALQALWTRFEALDFFARVLDEPGNLTAVLEATADGRRHRVAWIPRVEGIEPAETPLETFFDTCLATGRAAFQTR